MIVFTVWMLASLVYVYQMMYQNLTFIRWDTRKWDEGAANCHGIAGR